MIPLAKGECTSLDGQHFGRLTVTQTFRRDDVTYCRADCECGTKNYLVRKGTLTHKTHPTKSCGCLKEEMNRARKRIPTES